MTDEEKVRAAWQSVYKYGVQICVDCGSSGHSFGSWAIAAAFTAKQEQAIAYVDEEIALLNEQFAWSHPDNNYTAEAARLYSIYQRILKSREAHRAELARGMKA